jgi:hypothetical protein
MMTDGFAQALLVAGMDDWVHAAEIAWFASQEIPATRPEERRRVAVKVIQQLLSEGLIEVGDVVGERFVAWPAVLTRSPCVFRQSGTG